MRRFEVATASIDEPGDDFDFEALSTEGSILEGGASTNAQPERGTISRYSCFQQQRSLIVDDPPGSSKAASSTTEFSNPGCGPKEHHSLSTAPDSLRLGLDDYTSVVGRRNGGSTTKHHHSSSMAAEFQRRQRCEFTTKHHHPSSSASEDLHLSGDHTSRRCLLHPSASASKDLQRPDDHTSHRRLQSSAASDLRLSGDHASRRRCRSMAEKSSSSPILPSIAMDQPDSRPRRSDSHSGSTVVDSFTLEVSTTMFDDAEHALACVLEEFDAIDHSIEHKLSMADRAVDTMNSLPASLWAHLGTADGSFMLDELCQHETPSPESLGAPTAIDPPYHAPTAERTQPQDDIGRGEVVSGGLHDHVILGSAAPPATSTQSSARSTSAALLEIAASAAPPTNAEPSKSVALAATSSTAEILPSRAGNSDKLRIHGNRALMQRRFADAIELYTLSLAANPGNKAALLNRSMARAAIQRWDESIADSSLYLDAFGTDAIALYHRGFAKMMRNHGTHDIEGALVCFHHALSLSGSRTELIALLLNEIDSCKILLKSAYDTAAASSHRITRSSDKYDDTLDARTATHKTPQSLDGSATFVVAASSRARDVDHRTSSSAPALRTIGKPPSMPASVSAVSTESLQDSRDSQPVPLPQARTPGTSKPKRRKPRKPPSKQLAAARYKQRAAKRRGKE